MAVRKTASVKAVVNVTTDKCYENKDDLSEGISSGPIDINENITSSSCTRFSKLEFQHKLNGPLKVLLEFPQFPVRKR